MSTEDNYDIRKGPGVKWKQTHTSKYGHTSEMSGYTIDNLDQKELTEASSVFEAVFILTRDTLKNNSARCMDSEEDLLHCTQQIAKNIQNYFGKQSILKVRKKT